MKDKEIRKLERMGKRRFLKTMAGLGVSATTLPFLSQNGLAEVTDDPSEEIPYVHTIKTIDRKGGSKPPEQKPIFGTISRDRLDRIEAVNDAYQRVKEKVKSHSNIEVFVKESEAHGSVEQRVISVKHIERVSRKIDPKTDRVIKSRDTPDIDFSSLGEKIPQEVDGQPQTGNQTKAVYKVPVVVEKETREQTGYYDGYYRPVPPGCQFQAKKSSTENTQCTTGWIVYSWDRSQKEILTAGHCLSNLDYPELVCQPIMRGMDDIGAVASYIAGNYFDAGTISLGSSIDPTYRIAGQTDWRTSGMRTFNWIEKHQNGKDIYKQGRTTGRVSGPIVEWQPDNKRVVLDADIDYGDSGGPFFDVVNGTDAYLVAINGWMGGGNAIGTAAEEISDKMDLFIY